MEILKVRFTLQLKVTGGFICEVTTHYKFNTWTKFSLKKIIDLGVGLKSSSTKAFHKISSYRKQSSLSPDHKSLRTYHFEAD